MSSVTSGSIRSSAGLTRRDWLAATTLAGLLSTSESTEGKPVGKVNQRPEPKPVAAILTQYFVRSHADVLVGKILEGWKKDGGTGPALRLVSLYVDQFDKADVAREMAERFKVPIFDSIEKALTLGKERIAVDGVLSIGEHGNYPSNAKGQTLYPRRRFFQEIADAFEKYGRVVPVFNDKHLGPEWDDLLWMYRKSRERSIPLMASSSLVVGSRNPDPSIPLNSPIEAAVGIGYSGLDIYGFHALECYQCLVERRMGAETGVASVQCLTGEQLWNAIDSGELNRTLFDAALRAVSTKPLAEIRQDRDAAWFRFHYRDGFSGNVVMLPTTAAGNAVALRIRGASDPVVAGFEERVEPHFPHFAYLLKAIERLIHRGVTPWPLERTLITSGVLDRALTSRIENGRLIETPELHVKYQPTDYPHAPLPDLESRPEG